MCETLKTRALRSRLASAPHFTDSVSIYTFLCLQDPSRGVVSAFPIYLIDNVLIFSVGKQSQVVCAELAMRELWIQQ